MSTGNSTYSPLPQSNSDSDGSSEEELHVSHGNRIVNRASKTPNSKNDRAHNDTKNNVINYKPLDNEGEVGVTLNKFQSNPDEVSILKPYGSLEIFSTSRKICFVFSLLLCVFTTVAFIWILPCNVGTCPSTSNFKNYNFTWEKTLSNLEIYGPSSLLPANGKNYNLIFFTRNHGDNAKNNSACDMWCLKGKDGSQKWKIKLNNDPADVDCTLTDMNGDGSTDCLLYGVNSLKAINSQSGYELWDLRDSNKEAKILSVGSFPLIIPDLDRDDTHELLLPCSFAAENGESTDGDSFGNYLVIISGRTGEIINKPLRLNSCPRIHNLMFEDSSELSYACRNPNGKDTSQKIPLLEVYQSLKKSLKRRVTSLHRQTLNQHSMNDRSDSNTYTVNGYKLTLDNRGKCPEDCSVLINIKDERGNIDKTTIFEKKKANAYAMVPAVLKNKKESGFIIKFWKWCSRRENPEAQNGINFLKKEIFIKNFTRNIKKRSKKLNLLPNTSTILDNEMLLESEREFQREKRTASKVRKSGTSVLRNGNINLHVICETIVKVNFTEDRLIWSTLTEDEIIQICRKPHICQPNAYQQRHSILIAHPDKVDANLITFSSTYVHIKEKNTRNEEPWQFESRISVTDL